MNPFLHFLILSFISRFTFHVSAGLSLSKSRFMPLALLLLTLSAYADLQPVQFTDVTAEAGIHFRHVNGAKGDYHLPETIGAGGAFFDYDNDGALDLYLVNSGNWPGSPSEASSTSILYHNNGDGTFTDVTATAGVDNAGNYGQGVAVGDYDNDGNRDLYVTNFGPNALYHNNGDGTFTNVTGQAGVGDPLWSSSATFFDYDRDGNLDLYVVNYVHYSLDIPYRLCGDHGIRSYCHPSLFEGAPDRLYHNNGDGTFTDVTQAAGITDIGGPFQGKGLGVVAADFNNDGNLEIYVANDDTPNYLFYNNGDGTFTEIALLAGCAYSFDGVAQAGMGVDATDYNGDGFLDISVTNLSYETNTLYRNNGDGTFTDVSYEAHLGQESYLFVGFGTGFFDYDNDGHPDVFIANGHVIDNIERTSDVITYAQRNQLFHNNGDGTFTEVSFKSGAYFQRKGVGRGAIFGDYDNDGDVDIVVTQSNQPAELLRNEGGNRRNWLRVKTVGTPPVHGGDEGYARGSPPRAGGGSNRDGIGARVTVTVGSQLRTQEVHTGKSYLCSHDPRLFFGLGEHTTIDRLEIRWPSGGVQVIERIPANQELVVVEDDSEDLLYAVRKNDIEAVQIALNKGANVNTTDREGRTALMIAAQEGYANLAGRLIQNGADVNAKNSQGKTALMLAELKGHIGIVRMLKNAGAQ